MAPLPVAVWETAPVPAPTLRRLRRLLGEERRAQLERVALFEHSPADTALTVEWELTPALIARARQTIDEIDAALARINAGTYGWCETCGERLPIARLEAIPHARSCVACPPGRTPSGDPPAALDTPDGRSGHRHHRPDREPVLWRSGTKHVTDEPWNQQWRRRQRPARPGATPG